jgi:hypothetical protein
MHDRCRLRAMSKAVKLTSLLMLILVGSAFADVGETKWEFLAEKDGIHVWKREIPGSDMPGFRGQAFINASIYDIMTTMLDWKKHTEWMYGCEESTVLKELGSDHAILYNRVGAPWPVWDRDVIVDTVIERSADKRALVVNFKNIDSKLRPVPKKVVRLPRLVGFYKLWQVEPKKTKVLYQVETDAGGSLPRWLAIFGAKALPYETLNRLRERVEAD